MKTNNKLIKLYFQHFFLQQFITAQGTPENFLTKNSYLRFEG